MVGKEVKFGNEKYGYYEFYPLFVGILSATITIKLDGSCPFLEVGRFRHFQHGYCDDNRNSLFA